MKTVYSISEAVEPKPQAGDFFLKLLHSATNTHILHLQTKSYAEHKALQKFYEEIVDLTDTVIETWQGRTGTIAQYPSTYTPPKANGLDELMDLATFIDANRNVVGDQSELQNSVDEIRSLVDSTIYKLINLK
jgi:hypothetical protein